MSSPAGLCASGAAGVMVSGRCWVLMRHRGEQVASNVVYAIAFPLASIPEDLYSFTCCPDSSVVERHLGKMEVPGSIPGRGSDKPVSSEAGFFVCQFSLPIFFA